MILLTDVAGVLDKNKQLINQIEVGAFASLVDDGTISGGMIPKLETAVSAVQAGVGKVIIADGRVKNSVLRSLTNANFGTKIVKQP